MCAPLPSRRRSQRNRQLNQIPHSLGRSFVLTTALAKGRPLSSCISFHQRAAARCLSHSMLKKRDLENYKVSKYILAGYHLVQWSGELTLQAYLIVVNFGITLHHLRLQKVRQKHWPTATWAKTGQNFAFPLHTGLEKHTTTGGGGGD